MEGVLIALAMSFFIFSVFSLGVKFANNSNGITHSEIKQAKIQCEQHLPRDKHCEIVVTFKEVER